uniref:Uncharacterized protein n=1 Tax=Panagrolaimus davidi TaxID=227884 RepID=A0A914QZI0_9BILA
MNCVIFYGLVRAFMKMKGELQCDEMNKVVDVIKSQKNKCCRSGCSNYCWWPIKEHKPSTPCKLVKNDKIDWYLVYNFQGYLAIEHRENIYNYHYLLAEMFADDGFILNTKCKIEIV